MAEYFVFFLRKINGIGRTGCNTLMTFPAIAAIQATSVLCLTCSSVKVSSISLKSLILSAMGLKLSSILGRCKIFSLPRIIFLSMAASLSPNSKSSSISFDKIFVDVESSSFTLSYRFNDRRRTCHRVTAGKNPGSRRLEGFLIDLDPAIFCKFSSFLKIDVVAVILWLQ